MSIFGKIASAVVRSSRWIATKTSSVVKNGAPRLWSATKTSASKAKGFLTRNKGYIAAGGVAVASGYTVGMLNRWSSEEDVLALEQLGTLDANADGSDVDTITVRKVREKIREFNQRWARFTGTFENPGRDDLKNSLALANLFTEIMALLPNEEQSGYTMMMLDNSVDMARLGLTYQETVDSDTVFRDIINQAESEFSPSDIEESLTQVLTCASLGTPLTSL